MELQSKSSTNLKKIYTLKITSKQIEDGLELQAEKSQKNLQIDGFRKGHVPLDIIKKKYLPDLIDKVLTKQLNDAIVDEFTKNKYKLASSPAIVYKTVDFEKVSDAEIEVTFHLMPEIPEIDFKSIKIERPKLKLTEEELNKEIDIIRESNAGSKPIENEDHKVVNKNLVDIAFEGFIDGVAFEGGKAENYVLEIGSKTFIDTFEEQIIGHKKGDEFDVNVKFPADYGKEELQGKPALFKVKIHRIFEKTLPELDENFLKSLNVESVEKLKEIIQSQLENSYKESLNSYCKKEVFAILSDKYEFELPENILQSQIEKAIQREEKLSKDEENKDYKPKDEKTIKKDVEENLKLAYIIEKIKEEQKIEVSEMEFQQVILKEALYRGFNDYKTLLDLYAKNENAKNAVYDMIEENKVFEYITSQVELKEDEKNRKQMDEYIENLKNQKEEKVEKKKKRFWN